MQNSSEFQYIANLLARLPEESQAEAYEQCWRKDWQETEAHLLPAKNPSAWIQANLYLSLADAPFDREDPTLNLPAGACVTCPRRSGYNTSLFADVQGDQCLDGPCYQTKINAHIDREVASRPDLVQIENGYRRVTEQRPGAVQRGYFREIELADNTDAEPVAPCEAARPALIVYGRPVGTILTVCTDNNCPVHDPRAAARLAAYPAPILSPAAGQETEEEALERKQQYEQERQQYEEEQERRAEARRLEEEQREQEYEAEQVRREELRQTRRVTFERILENAPETLNAAQLRVLLRAIVNLDPYTFADDLAEEVTDEKERRIPEELLLATIATTSDDKLLRFAVRLALSGHVGIPRENETDFLTKAEIAFTLSPKKAKVPKTGKPPVDHSKPKTKAKKQTAAKKQIAA